MTYKLKQPHCLHELTFKLFHSSQKLHGPTQVETEYILIEIYLQNEDNN